MSVGVLVTGSPRSGTTLLTGFLEMMGFELRTQGQDRQFLENPQIGTTLSSIFSRCGMSLLTGEFTGDLNRWEPACNESFNQLCNEINELAQHDYWAFKNVNACRAFPVMEAAFAGRDMRYVVTVRDRTDCARSVSKFFKVGLGEAYEIHDDFVRCASLMPQPACHVYYEDLRANWRPVMECVAASLDFIPPDMPSDEQAAKWIH